MIGAQLVRPAFWTFSREPVYRSGRLRKADVYSPATFEICDREDSAASHPASPAFHAPFSGPPEASTVHTQTPSIEVPTATILTQLPGEAGRFSAFDQLPLWVAAELRDSWALPCEAAFDYLAERYPRELLQLVRCGNLSPVDLTLAAESVGRIPSGTDVRSCLKPLLEHADPLVREGALYGLMWHIDDATEELIRSIAEGDQSWAMRTAAQALLENLP